MSCSGNIDTCNESGGECLECGRRDCPINAEMHYWHDGCGPCGTVHDVIRALVEAAHKNAVAKGFYPGDGGEKVNIPEKLALIHAEISEGLEEVRSGKPHFYEGEKGKPEGLGIELADAVIRIFDLCGHLGIDLGQMILTKMTYNKTRPAKHGKLF